MEAFRLLGQEIPESLFEDKATQAKLKQFWSVLDDLAENNPLEYAKFIEQNLKSGLEAAPQSSESAETVRIRPAYCLKTFTTDQVPVSLNLLHSEKYHLSRVLGPLKTDRSLADPLDLDSWTHIPVSFRVREKDKAAGKKVVVDAVISTAVFLQAARDLKVKSQVLGHVVMRLERKLQKELMYKSGRFSWAKKEYVGGQCPTTHTLEPQASPRDYARFMEGETQSVVQQKTAELKPVVIASSPSPDPIPLSTASPQPVSPPLIQEIQQYRVKPVSSDRQQPPFHLFEERYTPHRDHFTLEIDLTGSISPCKAALEAAACSLRLSAPPNCWLELDFLVPVRGEEARARLKKRRSQIVITVPKA